MFSRGDYTQGLCTAHEYYIQYVTNDVLDTVSSWLVSSAALQSKRGICRDWSEVAHTLDTAIIRRAFEARGDEVNGVVLVCVAKCASNAIAKSTVVHVERDAQTFISDRGGRRPG